MHLTTIALGVAALAIALGVHETGHLLAGLLVRFRFVLFALGPIAVERREPHGIRVGWNREPSFWGGVACTLPKDSDHLMARFAAVVAGGPVASLVLSALAAALLLVGTGLPPAVRTELSWLRLLSFALFLATAVPIPNGAFVTDGLRFLRLVRKGPMADRELAILTLINLQLGGVPPSEWDQAVIDRGLVVRDGSMFEWQLHLFAYLRALDLGAIDEAGQALANATALAAHLPRSVQARTALEGAFFEATHRGDAVRARALLNKLPPRAFGVPEADQLRARTAVATAESRRDASDIPAPGCEPR